MIKANELRIGNLLMDKQGNIEQVWSIQDTGVLTKINEGPYDGYYLPIPLTEEWLLKLGFEITEHIKDRVEFKISGVDISIYEIYESGKWGNYIFEIKEFKHVYIKHVHQLQNLYFALTGEELTIKE